jgi:hypothetical protein
MKEIRNERNEDKEEKRRKSRRITYCIIQPKVRKSSK